MIRVALLLGVLASLALPAGASAEKAFPPLTSGIYPLVVDENASRFAVPPAPLVVNAGTVRFSVFIPKSAKGNHGIGIDGGRYEDIRGADVLPGRVTSLTIFLAPGNYTVFDSYKSNRDAGYSVAVQVVASKVRRPTGTRCSADSLVEGLPFTGELFATSDSAWQKHSTCRRAEEVAVSANKTWRASGYTATEISARGYSCTVRPFTSIGLTLTCKRGKARIVYAL